jgi:hypothetical protein
MFVLARIATYVLSPAVTVSPITYDLVSLHGSGGETAPFVTTGDEEAVLDDAVAAGVEAEAAGVDAIEAAGVAVEGAAAGVAAAGVSGLSSTL